MSVKGSLLVSGRRKIRKPLDMDNEEYKISGKLVKVPAPYKLNLKLKIFTKILNSLYCKKIA